MPCGSLGRQVCAAAALSSVCKPKSERSGGEEEETASHWRFFVCPSGINGTPSEAWLVAQENAMCPTDGPSKNEGASCADGQFCLGRVWRQTGKSAEARTSTNECLFKKKSPIQLPYHFFNQTKHYLQYATLEDWLFRKHNKIGLLFNEILPINQNRH